MATILVLINPKSRSGEKAEQEISEMLMSLGHKVIRPDHDKSRDDPNQLIRSHKDNLDYVLVGGGDGSVNYVLPALVETKIPLLLLPLGTANNLARSFNLPFETKTICELIENGVVQEIDLGKVNGIFFVNVAGLGLSTEVNKNVSSRLKKYLGSVAFVLTALKMSFKMNPFRAWIETNKLDEFLSHSWQISVCNGKFYGSGLTVKPSASLDDGKLHLLSTEVKSLWSGFKLIPSLFSGKFRDDHEVTLVSAEKIHIKTKRTFQIDVDGDLKTKTPAEFEVIRNALKIVVPQS